MSGAVALKPIHRVRQKNLSKVIKAQFDGNASECARKVKKSHTFMWQLINGYRSIGEDAARHIEKYLGLAERALDEKKQERTMKLAASDGNGGVTHYPLVEVKTLDALDAKTDDYMPYPLPEIGAKAKLFCAVLSHHEELRELDAGDRIFVDQADLDLVPRKLYVVQVKGTSGAMVMLVRKKPGGLVFATNRDKDIEYAVERMKVVGRVIMIVRPIPR